MTLDLQHTTIGFIGTGVMGRSMAGHLLAAGYPLRVCNRSRAKAADLVQHGAVWCDTPAAVAAGCDVVITIVGFPRDVADVAAGVFDYSLLGVVQGFTDKKVGVALVARILGLDLIQGLVKADFLHVTVVLVRRPAHSGALCGTP